VTNLESISNIRLVEEIHIIFILGIKDISFTLVSQLEIGGNSI
jgi:hypothetical protein